mgnify:CR=1 FL=1
MLKILHKKEKYTTKCIVNFLSIRYNLIMDIKYYEVLSRIGFLYNCISLELMIGT